MCIRDSIEVLVVPIHEIIERSKRGGIFSVAEKTGNFNYDFAKINGSMIPDGAIAVSYTHLDVYKRQV